MRPRETESTRCTANSNAWRNFQPVTGYNMFHIKLPCKLVKRPRIFLKVCTQQKTTQSRMFKCTDAQSTALALAIYYIKLKSHPSVRIFLVEWFFDVDARIHVKLTRNEVPVFWEHEVCFYNVLTPAVRHLRRFECQGVDDSCQNFTYIPANRSPDTIDNIYICFL